MVVDILRLVERTEDTFFAEYQEALQDMLVAYASQDRDGYIAARQRLTDVVSRYMAMGELIGAADQMKQSASVLVEEGPELMRYLPCPIGRHQYAYADCVRFAAQPLALAVVAYDEAVQEVAQRLPTTLLEPWERTAQRISELYSRDRVVAFVRAAEQSVTERAQAVIQQAIAEGWSEQTAGRAMVLAVDRVRKETQAWTEAYARMAFRTNLNTATTAGRFRQAQDPAVQRIMPAFRFDSVGDVDTRDNHQACDGLIFAVNNPVWNTIAPPLGYSCRCTVVQLSVPQLRRMGRIDESGNLIESVLPPNAGPDAGFRHGGRPDLFMGAV